jgi:hypothetical protein
MTARPSPAASPLVAVYDGRHCVGHVLARGKLGFESFNRDDRSVGVFATQREAIAALDEGAVGEAS